jgi:hypothetical protein
MLKSIKFLAAASILLAAGNAMACLNTGAILILDTNSGVVPPECPAGYTVSFSGQPSLTHLWRAGSTLTYPQGTFENNLSGRQLVGASFNISNTASVTMIISCGATQLASISYGTSCSGGARPLSIVGTLPPEFAQPQTQLTGGYAGLAITYNGPDGESAKHQQ